MDSSTSGGSVGAGLSIMATPSEKGTSSGGHLLDVKRTASNSGEQPLTMVSPNLETPADG